MSSRRAFVVGLDNYTTTPFAKLGNAVADAKSIAKILRNDYHFDVDPILGNCPAGTLKERRDKFLEDSLDADVILFFFACHGVQFGTSTYLVPTSVKPGRYVSHFLESCLSTEKLMSDAISSCKHAKRIFFYDCCRVNFDEWEFLDLDTYSSPAKLKIPANEDAYVYASRKNQPVSDGEGSHSPFTEALIAELSDPELALDQQILHIPLRINVITDTKHEGQQIEHHIGSELYGFHLREKDSYFKLDPEPFPPQNQGNKVTSLAVSTDGSLIAVAVGGEKEEGFLRILNSKAKRRLQRKKLPFKAYCVDFSPDAARVVFGCADGTVAVWPQNVDIRSEDAENDEPKYFSQRFKGPINAVEWSPKYNDLVIAGSTDGMIRVFASSGYPLAYALHNSYVWSLSFHKNGRLFISGSRDGTCRLWDVRETEGLSNRLTEFRNARLGFNSAVRIVRFSPDGTKLVVGTQSGKLVIYSFDENNLEFTDPIELGDPYTQRLTRKASKANADHLVKLLERNPKNADILKNRGYGTSGWTIEKKDRFLDESLYVISADISYDNKVLAYGTNIDGYYLIDLEDNSYIGSLESHRNEAYHSYRVPTLCFNSATRKLVIGHGRNVQVLNF